MSRKRKQICLNSICEGVSDIGEYDSRKICIGQALAVLHGSRLGELLHQTLTLITPDDFSKMIKETKNPETQNNLMIHKISSIPNHSTLIIAYKVVNITHIWYYNPWGSEADMIYFNKKDKKFRYNKCTGSPGDRSKKGELWWDHNIRCFFEDLVQSSTGTHITDLDNWNKEAMAASASFPRYARYHPMSLIYLLMRKHGAEEDVVLYHPTETNPRYGRQRYETDLEKIPHRLTPGDCASDYCDKNEVSFGTCAVWSQLYVAELILKVKKVYPQLMENGSRENATRIMRTIIGADNNIDALFFDQRDPLRTLGKVVYTKYRDKHDNGNEIIEYLEVVFDSIPTEKEIFQESTEGKRREDTAYHKQLNKAFLTFQNVQQDQKEEQEAKFNLFLYAVSNGNKKNQSATPGDIKGMAVLVMLLVTCKHGGYFDYASEILTPMKRLKRTLNDSVLSKTWTKLRTFLPWNIIAAN